MDFNLKQYRKRKIKEHLKGLEPLFFYHTPKMQTQEWIKIEQIMKSHKLTYYTISTSMARQVLKSSVYRSLGDTLSGSILVIKPQHKTSLIDPKLFRKIFDSSFLLIAVRINHQFYSKAQLSLLSTVSYKLTVFELTRQLIKYTKVPYVLTNSK